MSVAVALAGVAGVAASGWALQAAALPPPRSAARVAADASAWFHEYRLVTAVFHYDHRRSNGACVRGWSTRRSGMKIRASTLSFPGGPVLRVFRKRQVSVVAPRRRRRFPPALLAAAAGCSRLLAGAFAAAAQGVGRLTTERSYAANRPAVALEFDRGRRERLTLYVSPRTDRPLVAFVDLDREKITARIYLQRVTTRMLARFGLPRYAKPRRTR